MTWVSAITAVFQAGGIPHFCDIEPDTPNLDPAGLVGLGNTCSAVLVTHAWGIPARMDLITEEAGMPVVEDCSHAHGARYRGRPVGSWGTAGCFSLQESKAVSGGEGGVLVTFDRRVYESALTLGHHPSRLAAELTHADLLPLVQTGAAFKFRMPALSAGIAREQLRGLAARSEAAEQNLAILAQVLRHHDAPVSFPVLDECSSRGWYGTPLIIVGPVGDSAALFDLAVARGLPLRRSIPTGCAPRFSRNVACSSASGPMPARTARLRPASSRTTTRPGGRRSC